MRLSEKEIRKIVRKRILESMLLSSKRSILSEGYKFKHQNLNLKNVGRSDGGSIELRGNKFKLKGGGETVPCLLLAPDPPNRTDPFYAIPVSFLKTGRLEARDSFYKTVTSTTPTGAATGPRFEAITKDAAGLSEMNDVIAKIKEAHSELMSSIDSINNVPNVELQNFDSASGFEKLYEAMNVDPSDTGHGTTSSFVKAIMKESKKFDKTLKMAAAIGTDEDDLFFLGNFQIDGKGKNINHPAGDASPAMRAVKGTDIKDDIENKTSSQLKDPETWAGIFNQIMEAGDNGYSYLDLACLSAICQSTPALQTRRTGSGLSDFGTTLHNLNFVKAIVFFLGTDGTDGRHLNPTLSQFKEAFQKILDASNIDPNVKNKLETGDIPLCYFTDTDGASKEMTTRTITQVNQAAKDAAKNWFSGANNITTLNNFSLDVSNNLQLNRSNTTSSPTTPALGGTPGISTRTPVATPSNVTPGTITISQSQTQFGHAEDPNAVGGITMKLSTASDTSVKTFEDLGYAPGLDKLIKRHLRGLVKNDRKFRGATIKMEVFYDKNGMADIKFHGGRDRLSTLQTSKLRRELREYINNSNIASFVHEEQVPDYNSSGVMTGTHKVTTTYDNSSKTLKVEYEETPPRTETIPNLSKKAARTEWFTLIGKEKMMSRGKRHHVDVIIELY